MTFWKWMWWKMEEASLEDVILAYAYDNFEEFPPSERDMLYYDLFEKKMLFIV